MEEKEYFMIKLKMLLCVLQALLMTISSFSVYDSAFKFTIDRWAAELTSETDFGFDSISAKEMQITDSEKQNCRRWYEENILTSSSPAYDFKAGGKDFRNNIKDWEINVGNESAEGEKYRGGKTSIIGLKHKNSVLAAEVEATIYEEYATCEWTVKIKNEGGENSPVIKDFYAADCTLETGVSDLYYSKGSKPAADDFELMRSAVCITPMTFNANGGRSEAVLPYFNISGKSGGIVAAVGWTGQWYTSLRQTAGGVKFKAKQEFFDAWLAPGEEVRSPLVSLTFYGGNNALKGFNTFRAFERDCVYPESIETMNGYVIANEFSTKTCDELIAEVNSIDDEIIEGTDYFWMDAGWYEYNEGWYDGVGNWIPDKSRFPDGLKPLSDAMAARGKKFLLWYEPERVRENTALYNEGKKHSDWIVQIDDNLMWNLGSDGARDYLKEYISKSLIENGVSIYRQDFNFSPLKYWQKADKEYYGGREGICENHYVTNLYAYLDCLLDSIDGLVIDNCASGGKRLDLEMTRRSLPLWRSDYNCGNADGTVKEDVLEATQSMTYGLSCWFVYTGTNRLFHSEYASRSAILTNQSVYQPIPSEYNKYADVSEYMTEYYYPLTYGGTDRGRILAMQFGNESKGAAVIYKRENVNTNSYRLVLNGLSPDKIYSLTDIDNPAFVCEKSGKELMTRGIELNISETPKAVIIRYGNILTPMQNYKKEENKCL